MTWEVLLCVAGRRTVARSRVVHLATEGATQDLVFPFWVLRSATSVVLVDTGFSARVAEEREVVDHRPVDVLLRELGLVPADIDDVVVSHLHYDHFADPHLFPGATFHVQRRDVEYFTGRGRSHPAGGLADAPSTAQLGGLAAAGRLRLLDGEGRLAGGLRLVRIGGHTPGSQICVVEAAAGTAPGAAPVVLACDSAHLYESLETRTPAAVISSYDDYQSGFDTIVTAAAGGRWLPGHDPGLLRQVTPVGDGVHRLLPDAAGGSAA